MRLLFRSILSFKLRTTTIAVKTQKKNAEKKMNLPYRKQEETSNEKLYNTHIKKSSNFFLYLLLIFLSYVFLFVRFIHLYNYIRESISLRDTSDRQIKYTKKKNSQKDNNNYRTVCTDKITLPYNSYTHGNKILYMRETYIHIIAIHRY